MFTIEKIIAEEQKIQSGADFPQFIKTLKDMGVVRNDVYVMNGHSIYFSDDDHTAESGVAYESLIIEETSSEEELREAIKIHRKGETDFQTFCRKAAAAGVEKWITDLKEMTVSYLDISGHEVVGETIAAVN